MAGKTPMDFGKESQRLKRRQVGLWLDCDNLTEAKRHVECRIASKSRLNTLLQMILDYIFSNLDIDDVGN